MEKMRVVLITLLLFIGAAVAEKAGNGKAANNPAEDASDGEHNLVEEAGGIGDAITPAEGKALISAYESARFKKFVTHCSSHVAQTCSGNDPLHASGRCHGINVPLGLSFCLFDSMEKCLGDHEAKLIDPNPGPMSAIPNSIQSQQLLIETVKFRTVLKTCTRVSAKFCLSAPNVDTSVLPACLGPSLNQCVYPAADAFTPGPPLELPPIIIMN
uniref:Nodulin-27 n=1 Tax=Glycine max TaxID=3847 RepID=NO27_SOYBN|nr:nodulin-27 precursor [Glycine max]P08864.1 RecName: Full=Nodulin-27; Short=N-27; Flags: Precursor [Glycine max]CAA28742.1 unnamed protein product [Glycine max]